MFSYKLSFRICVCNNKNIGKTNPKTIYTIDTDTNLVLDFGYIKTIAYNSFERISAIQEFGKKYVL